MRERSLGNLTDEEKGQLSIFIAVQFMRVKGTRTTIADINRAIETKFRAMGFDPQEVENFEVLGAEEIKKASIRSIIGSIKLVPYIYDKAWTLLKTSRARPFFISDNPITLQNMYDFSPRGSLGLAVKGIEVYFPISKTLSLSLFCRSHEYNIRDVYRKHMMLQRISPASASQLKVDFTRIKQLHEGLETGRAIPSRREDVINLNSLQVVHSSRFIYSSTDDFELVLEMLQEHPELKEGPHIEAN